MKEIILRVLCPLTVTRTRVITESTAFQTSYIGYMTIYVFGIRVAKIQMTNPWD